MNVKRNEAKKKRLLDEAHSQSSLLQAFFDVHPCPVEKRRTSMCAALRVSDLQATRLVFFLPKAQQAPEF